MESKETWQSTILSKFKNTKKTPKGYLASCSAHEDKNPSLLINFVDTADGAKAQIKCLTGCEWSDIIASAGLEKQQVFFNTNGHHKKQPAKKERAFVDIDFAHPQTIYSYTDESGNELYQNCRYETDKLGNRLDKKTFRQRHKIGDEWAYSLNGLRRVPYNFHNLVKEPNLIFDCEGEKDAESLRGLGFTATSTLKESFGELHKFCLGKIIVVCEDNDIPGYKKAEEKAETYWKTGAECVKILQFRDMPEHSDVSDWIQADPENDIFALQIKIDDIPPYNPLQSITVDFLREVTPRKPLISIDGRNALPSGNVGGIVAGIGQGKSHLAEIIISSAIEPGCEPDSRIEVDLAEGERIALLDTEQPADDCQSILYRAHKRTGQKDSHLTPDHREFKKFTVMSLINLELAERREKLSMVIKRPEFKLIVIDGILDFVANPNDPAEAATFIIWLHAMAAKHDKGIFCIVHGNRNDLTGKGKGWIGDIFQRKATCFLMLRKHKLDPSIRVLTTEFENVKFRKADDTGLNIAMQWDIEFGGFRCIPYQEEEIDKITPEQLFKKCFYGVTKLSKKDLVVKYRQLSGKAKATAYRDIENALGMYLEKKNIDGKPYHVLLSDF